MISDLSSPLGRALFVSVSLCITFSFNPVMGDVQDNTSHPTTEEGFRIGAWRNWFFVSFLPEGTEAESLGLETESYFPLGSYEVKNISYLEGADYPRPIPGQPPGNVSPGLEIEAGINDLLTAFWFSKKGTHHGKHHFSLGFAAQLRIPFV